MKAFDNVYLASVKADHFLSAVDVGTSGLQSWIRTNLVGLAILAIGIILVWSSRQRQHGATMEIVGGVIVGLVIIGMSFGTSAADVGKFFTDLVVN